VSTLPVRLASDVRGIAAVEFALVAPVLLIAMMGMFDAGYNMYTDAQLHGAVQASARSSTIEGASGSEAAIDAYVSSAVHAIAPSAILDFERKNYANFNDVARPEEFTDSNSNGVCDAGEPFDDTNGNTVWDADRGSDGFGSARDAVLYTVTITYPRPFPVVAILGQDGTFTMVAKTVLRNQPYGLPGERSDTGNCT
jgi:TadE-like protein